ncbi:uncharacterized protein LOC121375534 [Gigantopelta aegis]|uniref:uncharacterized protein LOC121375534 n=1 Tax=Gigantopelta aegis TaxID=1735272 RepID=UPI001B88AD6B|nr:uncharacterized protein LOC121375534 [Gigantopelta aegis]XP_041358971.1 uncharacterized protein LOC121375534 [Gigantopelta aegis]
MSWLVQVSTILRRRIVIVAVTILTIVLVLLSWLPWKQSGDDYLEDEDFFVFDNLNRFIPSKKPFYDFIDPDDSHVMDSFFAHKPANKSTRLASSKPIKINIHIHDPKVLKRRSDCVRLETPRGFTPICLYDVKVDGFISSFIRDYRTWEPDLVRGMNLVLHKHPDMHLVDIGSSVGVYTLNAASVGRNVVAIDALKSNLDLLHSSLVYGKLNKRVTLVWNALSDHRMRVSLKVGKDNIGGTRVDHKEVDTKQPTFLHKTPEADAIFLDDLTSLVSSAMHKVYMKMDVESSEARVLKKSSEFFQTLDVQYVQMEWMMQRNKDGLQIVHFMTRNGFLPYSNVSRTTLLHMERYAEWPDNIVWMKR